MGMNTKNQIVCVWAGILAVMLFYIAFWPLLGMIPPWPPSESALEVVARYQQHTTSIRMGSVLLMLAAALLAPFFAVITTQMMRIEGRFAALSLTQILAGAGVYIFIVLPGVLFSVAAFRPDRAPEITQTLNDMAWIIFVMTYSPAVVQNFAIGYAIISDKSPKPVFPRWVGFFNFWVGLLFAPGCMITFFKAGPFAWNGVISFWIPAIIFSVWFFVMVPVLFRVIREQAQATGLPAAA
jgi:MFS family permease